MPEVRPQPVTRARRTLARRSARGVTLLELMAVITIIGLFAVLAFPSMGAALRQRHAAAYAREAFGELQLARARAAATGAAHAVFYDATTQSFFLRMAIDASGGPVSSCTQPAWANSTPTTAPVKLGDNQLIGAVSAISNAQNLSNDFTSDPLTITLTGTSTNQIVAVCYSPSGAVYWMANGSPGVWNHGIPFDPAGPGWSIALTSGGATAQQYNIVMGPNGLPNFVVP